MPALSWKQWVRIALGALLALNIALFLWNAQARASNPASQAAQLERLRRQHDALGQDVRAAVEIRDRLPDVTRQCDRFLDEQLLPVAAGYSAVLEDLTEISKRTGLHTRGVTYKEKELAGRRVAEVQISATVEGGYSNLVRFINELERSKQFYVLEELALVESNSNNSIRLGLQLKTYFRLK